MNLNRFLICCLFIFFEVDVCSAQLGDSFQLSINDQEYTCRAEGPDPISPVQQSSTCSLTSCMLEFLNASLRFKENTENHLATGSELSCSSFKVYLSCFQNMVRNVCSFTPSMAAQFEVGILKGLEEMIDFYEENCMCLESMDVNPTCQNKSPCQLFNPCLNGGQCLTDPVKKRACDSKCRRSLDEADEFVRCKCPRGFCGKFCQNCKNCKKCRKLDECKCPERYGGPVCTMRCEDIVKNKRALYHACLQVTMDDYYKPDLLSQCFLNFEMGNCIAATAKQCGFDPFQDAGDDRLKYWISAVAQIPLESGGCITFGNRPKIS